MENLSDESQNPPGEDHLPSKPDGSTAGVRRVNNVPLLIIGGVLAVFVILVGTMITRRQPDRQASAEKVQGALPESARLLDHLLISGATAGVVEDVEAVKAPPPPTIPVARVPDVDLPPSPPRGQASTETATAVVDEHAAERMNLLHSALLAKTSVGAAPPATSSAVTPSNVEPGVPKTTGGAARSPQARDSGAEDDTDADPADSDEQTSHRNNYAQFDRQPGPDVDRWKLDSSLESPRSRYELRAGGVIPAVMISGIDSDLSGQIIAQVSQDVFDTATGRHRLIPQGTRLIGRYDLTIYGQSRLLVAWQRMVYPDGRALDIGAMHGVDSAGYAGFAGSVDRHYLRVFGSAILLSGITAGLNRSEKKSRNDRYNVSNTELFNQALAQQLGAVATGILEKNIDVAPTLRIRPGYRFNVMAVKDMTFERPYVPFR